MEPLYIRPGQAPSLVQVSRTTIYVAMKKGELPSRKVGTTRLIAVSDLRAWIERQPLVRDAHAR